MKMKKYLRLGIACLCLFLIVSMGRSTWGLLGKGDAIEEEQKHVDELKAEQERLMAIKETVDSPEFIEKEARDKLGLAKPGETVLVLPPDEVLKKFAPSFDEEEFIEEKTISERWIQLFFQI
jgi:hypothetical protein